MVFFLLQEQHQDFIQRIPFFSCSSMFQCAWFDSESGFFMEQRTERDDVFLIQVFLDPFNVFSNLQPGSSSKSHTRILYIKFTRSIYFCRCLQKSGSSEGKKKKPPVEQNFCHGETRKTKVRLKEDEVSEAKKLLKARTGCVNKRTTQHTQGVSSLPLVSTALFVKKKILLQTSSPSLNPSHTHFCCAPRLIIHSIVIACSSLNSDLFF